MKKMLFLLALICLEKALHAQYIYTIKADSVKITNSCDTAELIIENHTQTVPGFLFNKGRGRTEFRRAERLNDSTLVFGGDTFMIRGNTTASNGLSMHGRDVQLGGTLIKDTTVLNFNSKALIFNSGSGDKNFLIRSNNYGFGTESPVNYYSQLNFYIKDTAQRQSVIGYYNGHNYDSRNFFVSIGDEYTYSDYPVTGAGMRFEIRTGHSGSNKTTFFRNGNVGVGTGTYRLTDKLAVAGNGLFTDTLKLPNIKPKSDTSAFKPIVSDANGNIFKMTGWPSTTSPAIAIVNSGTSDITATVGTLVKLPDLTGAGSHSVALPDATAFAGQKIYIWNMNNSGNFWTFSSSVTLPNGTTSNAVPNQSTIELLSDGSVWVKWK